MNQEQLINQLAGLIDSLQNIKKGFSRTGGGAGRQVEVRMEGRSGTVRAKALTNIPPGECTVLRTESGEWVVVSGLNPQIIKDEIISQEQNRRKKPPKKTGNAIVPILISKTVPKEKEAKPDCTCTSWRLKKVIVNKGTPQEKMIEIPYESCDGSEESYKDKNAAEEAAFGPGGGSAYAWHYKFDVKGQIHGSYAGLPWSAGLVHCVYPGAAFYGYNADNAISGMSRDGKSYNDIALWGLNNPSFNLMTPERLFAQYGVVIRAPQSVMGTGFLVGVNGIESLNSSINQLGEMFGYYPLGDPSIFEGAVIRRSGLPNTGLSAFRPLLAFYDYDEITPGGGLAYLLPLKDHLPPYVETDGQKILCLTSLSRGWYDWDGTPIGNTWGAYQTSEACLTGLPEGTDKLDDAPQDEEDGKYLMTQYYIGGITEELFEIPHVDIRGDDPNCGYISVNHTKQEIYVAIKCGSDRINTQVELEQNLDSEWVGAMTPNEFDPYMPVKSYSSIPFSYQKIYEESGTNQWDLKDDVIHVYPDDRVFYQYPGYLVDNKVQYFEEVRSKHFPSLFSSLTRCCAIHLFTLKYEKAGKAISLSLVSQNTYTHGQTIPNDTSNWKHPLMGNWMTSSKAAFYNTGMNGMNVLPSNDVWKYLSSSNIGGDKEEIKGKIILLPEGYNRKQLDINTFNGIGFYNTLFSINFYYKDSVLAENPTNDPSILTVATRFKGMSDESILKAVYGTCSHVFYDVFTNTNTINFGVIYGAFMPFGHYGWGTEKKNQTNFSDYEAIGNPEKFIKAKNAIINREDPIFTGASKPTPGLFSIESLIFYPEIFSPGGDQPLLSTLELLKRGVWGGVIHGACCVAANLVNNEIWAIDFDQRVPALDPTTIENLFTYINEKRTRDDTGLRWRLLYNDDLITAEVRIVIPTPDTVLEDTLTGEQTHIQENKTIFKEGLSTATAKIYPLKFTPGTDRGFTVWGAAPAPWKETLE